MDLTNEILQLIGQPENSQIEYKGVLPPSRNIAQLVSSFANTDGGYIILGIAETASKKLKVVGLSEDFYANAITHKALDLLTPRPQINYQLRFKKGKY
jgi:predicted HTH transcriptional regulator